ncbi:MAG: TIGR00153 family protein [Proteobacteria bacterium]|nr:TIGR00153 family protein [Pseudomonadota bacterium]MBU4287257.1 TIGR00153 family protein [Pseudomonadota bacterium]MBU4414007.1 TIGR00153 family protein [Pseudomonadota bacterium]
MFLEKILSLSKKEQEVTDNMRKHIKLLCSTCDLFRTALEKDDRNLMRKLIDLERESDSIRREIISKIYEGAFLPYLRPDLCRFVEIVDHVFDVLEDIVLYYLDGKIPEQIKNECIRVAYLNLKICEMFLITFETMLKGDDLREKTLAIRIYEKKIDDIKFSLIKDIRKIPINNFWEGKTLSDFISGITNVSDIIEDASDYLQIINVSMK